MIAYVSIGLQVMITNGQFSHNPGFVYKSVSSIMLSVMCDI